MPLFDFECPHCNHKEEHVVFSTDVGTIFVCPKCESVLRKQRVLLIFRLTSRFQREYGKRTRTDRKNIAVVVENEFLCIKTERR